MVSGCMLAVSTLFVQVIMSSAAEAQTPAQTNAAVSHWESALIDSVAKALRSGPDLAAALAPAQPFLHLVLRRTGRGEAELHEAEIDLVQVRSGRARVTIGGILQGSRRVAGAGEWRGDGIEGGSARDVAAGDILVIPARIPHLWEPIGTEPFVYVIVKVPTR